MMVNREFKLEVQPNSVCRFAPEGRDVYSPTVVSLLRSSLGAQSLLACLAAKVRLPGFAPNGAISFWAAARSHKHLAPLERKLIQLSHLQFEFTIRRSAMT